MGLLRGLAGAVLWIVAALLALVAVVLCVTVILLPVGLPLLGYARRMFTLSLKLIVPRAVSHPVKTAEKSAKKRGRKARRNFTAERPDIRMTHRRRRHVRRRFARKLSLNS
jgi:hypothetical protein